MDDALSELLKSLQAAKDLLPVKEDAAEATPEGSTILPPRPDQQGERKVSLGDAAKRHKDYEREPFDKR